MALLLLWHGLIILQVLQPSQGPSSSPLPISSNDTNTMVNQTIVPDKAILPAGDVYTTGSSSDVKQAQESTNLPDQYTSSDSFRLVTPSIAVIIGILGTLLSLTLILVLLYVKHCKSTSSTPMVSFYNHDHRRSILNNNYDNIGMNINMIRNPHLSSSFHLDYLYSHPPSMLVTARTDSGIDRNVVESLPLFSYSVLKGFKDGLECAVCLSKYENPDILRLLPACKHAFHVECVDLWLLHHSTCPLCRHKVEPYHANTLYNGNIYMEDCSSMMCNDNVEVNALSDEIWMSSQWHSSRRTNSTSRHVNSASQSVTSGISCRATSLERSNKVEFYVQDRDLGIGVNDGDDAQCDVVGEGGSNNITLEDIPSTSSSWRKYITSDGPMSTSGTDYTRPNGTMSPIESSCSSHSSSSSKGINSVCDPTNSRRREASYGGDDQAINYYALMRNIMMNDDHALSRRMGRYDAKGRGNHIVLSKPNCDEDYNRVEMEKRRLYHSIHVNVVSGQCSANDEIYHDRV